MSGAFGLGADRGYAEWSLNMFRSLRIGGVWGVPRSGLVFTRTGPHTLALTEAMPHDPAMPISAEELLAQQASDFEAISLYMTQAGVAMSDATGTF